MTAQPKTEFIYREVGIVDNPIIIEGISSKKTITPFVLETYLFFLQITFSNVWARGMTWCALAGPTVGSENIHFTLVVQVQGKIGKGEQQGKGRPTEIVLGEEQLPSYEKQFAGDTADFLRTLTAVHKHGTVGEETQIIFGCRVGAVGKGGNGRRFMFRILDFPADQADFGKLTVFDQG